MSNGILRVTKTLVIGLGSTGTHICNEVARRIEWEVQELDRAPWVQFLTIETNANEPSRFHHSGDFLTLEISAEEFNQVLEYTQAFDEKINLSSWVDPTTLQKLPGKEVAAGAGNIRMVGRLAFLYESNYNAVKQAVISRMANLRDLSDNDATGQLGQLPDGSSPQVEFGDAGRVRVIVAGTLCGGTCSGLAADFGYFLKALLQADEKVTAIFTLPRQDLAPAVEPKAERFKKNAYHALIELNHYHLSGREHEPRIKFPDNIVDGGRFPYDLPYLTMPRQAVAGSLNELKQALADRIFLNIFAPQTDPFAHAVDATVYDAVTDTDKTVMDRQRRAHVFCTFGLSTIEFPVQQVMEACSKRLLAHAIQNWRSRALDSSEESDRLDELGLSWSSLLESLRRLQSGDNLQQRLKQKRDEVMRLARRSAEEAEKSVDELRQGFSTAKSSSSGSLPAGIVPKTFQENRRAAAEAVLNRVRTQTEKRLLAYNDGPAPLKQVLNRVAERISELQVAQAPTLTGESEVVDDLLREIRQIQRSTLLRMFFLRRPSIERLIPKLREALDAEINIREKVEAHRALQHATVRGAPEIGVLDWITRLLRPVQQRVNRLMERSGALAEVLNRRANELARTTPDLNGICIFEPESSAGSRGSVCEEFERCLIEYSGDAAADWREVRERVAAEVIREWETLPAAVVPTSKLSSHEDWILAEFAPGQQEDLILPNDLSRLEGAARRPFLRLTQVDVLERWRKRGGADISAPEARMAAQQAKPFLDVSRPLAERGGRSPIVSRRMVLAPASPVRDAFLKTVKTAFGMADEAVSPDKFRAILLEEWFRFPLSGATSVLGTTGLCTATCRDFPTFFTRKDVPWTGLSEAEVAAFHEAEELLTLALLLDLIEPKAGALIIPWDKTGPTDPGLRHLPLSMGGATQILAKEEADKEGRSLLNARRLLRDKIAEKRRSYPGESRSRDRAFLQHLEEAIMHSGSEIPGWNADRAGECLARFCAADEGLCNAFREAYPPPSAAIEGLWRSKGDEKPGGGIFSEPGFYCSECGGLFGKDEQEAMRAGWRCFVNPEHVAFPRN